MNERWRAKETFSPYDEVTIKKGDQIDLDKEHKGTHLEWIEKMAMKGILNLDLTLNKSKTINVRAFEKHWIDFEYQPKGLLKGKFCSTVCCRQFLRLITDLESPVYYIAKNRSFFFVRTPEGYRSQDGSSRGFTIFNCPMCGFRFDPDLSSQWTEIVAKKFKIDDFWDEGQLSKISQEYLTEDWWLKEQDKFKNNDESLLERFKGQMCDQFKGKELAEIMAQEIEKTKNLDGVCCTRLYEVINYLGDCPDFPDKKCSDYPMEYFPERRLLRLTNTPSSYLLHNMYRKEKITYRTLFYNIFFCPLCGAKLPESLVGQWYKEIHEKFGVYDIFNKHHMAKVPQKYLTEEWWKELGL